MFLSFMAGPSLPGRMLWSGLAGEAVRPVSLGLLHPEHDGSDAAEGEDAIGTEALGEVARAPTSNASGRRAGARIVTFRARR